MGKISKAEFAQLAAAAADLENLPLFIDDTAGLTISGLHTRVRRLQRRQNNQIGLVIVDYLQLLTGSARASGDGRVQEISEISRGLKTLAKDLNVPVLALSQLSRAVEQREDKRPQLSDLRESGSIEQDADIVMFVYREDYYIAAKEPKIPREGDDARVFDDHAAWATTWSRVHGLAELIIAKQRHGATGKVTMKFEANITRFSDYVGEAGYRRRGRILSWAAPARCCSSPMHGHEKGALPRWGERPFQLHRTTRDARSAPAIVRLLDGRSRCRRCLRRCRPRRACCRQRSRASASDVSLVALSAIASRLSACASMLSAIISAFVLVHLGLLRVARSERHQAGGGSDNENLLHLLLPSKFGSRTGPIADAKLPQ